VVAVLLSYWMTIVWTHNYVPKLIIMTGIGAACVVWLMMKAIFTRTSTGFAVEGILLSEQAAPRFWAHVRAMAAQIGTEPPTHIIAGIDDNFFVTENPVILDDTRIEGRTLFVSFSLLKFLEQDEANAILAHELAHFSGDDTAYTKKMTPALAGYSRYLGALWSGGPLSRPLFHFMRLFWVLFQLSLSRMSRQREYRADALSAKITSPAHAGRALLKVVAYASYRRQVEQALFAQNEQHQELGIAGRVATGFGSYATSSRLIGDLSSASYPHPLDDHPRLEARLAAVRAPIVPSHYARMLTEAVSHSWLDDIDGATDIERQMWTAYEQRFADAHEEALAWRYLPASDAERAHVEKFFPAWEVATKKSDATLHGDIETIRFSEWPAGRIAYGDIKECKVRESLGRKFLTIKVNTPAAKVEIPLHRFANQPELLNVFERYLARHQMAVAHQQKSQDSSAA
jgi:Zn-dependent protease with chaperone function